jgi:hypothetical protein
MSKGLQFCIAYRLLARFHWKVWMQQAGDMAVYSFNQTTQS